MRDLGIWLAPCIIILPRIVAHDIFIEPVLLVGRLFARFVILLGCVARDDLGGVNLSVLLLTRQMGFNPHGF